MIWVFHSNMHGPTVLFNFSCSLYSIEHGPSSPLVIRWLIWLVVCNNLQYLAASMISYFVGRSVPYGWVSLELVNHNHQEPQGPARCMHLAEANWPAGPAEGKGRDLQPAPAALDRVRSHEPLSTSKPRGSELGVGPRAHIGRVTVRLGAPPDQIIWRQRAHVPVVFRRRRDPRAAAAKGRGRARARGWGHQRNTARRRRETVRRDGGETSCCRVGTYSSVGAVADRSCQRSCGGCQRRTARIESSILIKCPCICRYAWLPSSRIT
jgi:hypothetical protein